MTKSVRPNKSAGLVQSKPYGCECFVPSNPAGLLHKEGLFSGNYDNTGLFAVSTTMITVVATMTVLFSITTPSATKCLFNGYITA